MSRATTLAASDIGVQIAGREILRDVALTISPGELIAVAGPNGAGKSTLLRVLAGLTQPDTGSVRLGDMDVRTMDRRSLGRAIAYLPQDRTVHWPLKVRAVVALGRIPHGSGPQRGESDIDRATIQAALKQTDTEALADRSIGELSGGERARVLIARALAQDAGILIADEPAAGLDPAHALALFETFVAIAAQGRAVIVALHDLSLALRYCPRTLLLKDGEVAASGHARDVLTEPMIARVYGITATIAEIAGVPCVIPVSVRP
ncbi:MAG: ABC transporter ATP-binding protein [Hyphomicrobium sp.]|nr:ABC transporter ATP-binding protein [Hyphomicrobium sp.]